MMQATDLRYGDDSAEPGWLDGARDGGILIERKMGAGSMVVVDIWVKRFACEGLLNAKRVNDKGEILFEPLSGPLPTSRRGKRLRDRRRYPKLTPHMRKEVQYEA